LAKNICVLLVRVSSEARLPRSNEPLARGARRRLPTTKAHRIGRNAIILCNQSKLSEEERQEADAMSAYGTKRTPRTREGFDHLQAAEGQAGNSKLDRLSRYLAFIAALMDSGVEFVAVDNPHANKLTVHILAAVAQHEREMIAQRTKDAPQAAMDWVMAFNYDERATAFAGQRQRLSAALDNALATRYPPAPPAEPEIADGPGSAFGTPDFDVAVWSKKPRSWCDLAAAGSLARVVYHL
jgi:hypothetical protein